MNWPPVLLYGALAAVANILGGLGLSFHPSLNQKWLKYMIAFGAGFMLAAVFLKVIPVSLTMKGADSYKVMLLVLVGYLLVQFFEHTLASHFHFGEETHQDVMLSKYRALQAIFGLSFHTFFDGVSIASGFSVNKELGILIFLAIILHKLPEGFTVASIILASGRGRGAAVMATFFVGLATLAGTFSVGFLEGMVSYALPLSAGVTLYVAASDLIPEVNNSEERVKVPLAVFVGVLLFYATETALELLHVG
ncbi:MAG: ZIP family metal transporter [Blastocatellia bacterium]|nr:ZIP family metal transporter [Blastocatellia bacterium]